MLYTFNNTSSKGHGGRTGNPGGTERCYRLPQAGEQTLHTRKNLFTSTETTLGCIFLRSQSSPPQSSPVRDPYHPSCAPRHFDDNTKLRRKEDRCSRGFGSPGLPARSCYCPSPWGSIRPCSQEGQTCRGDSFSWIREGIRIGK